MKYLGLMWWHENYTNELIPFKLNYRNEYDISTKYVIDYNYDALLMLIFTGHLKKRLYFLALRYMFLVHKVANLHITSIRFRT